MMGYRLIYIYLSIFFFHCNTYIEKKRKNCIKNFVSNSNIKQKRDSKNIYHCNNSNFDNKNSIYKRQHHSQNQIKKPIIHEKLLNKSFYLRNNLIFSKKKDREIKKILIKPDKILTKYNIDNAKKRKINLVYKKKDSGFFGITRTSILVVVIAVIIYATVKGNSILFAGIGLSLLVILILILSSIFAYIW